MALYELNEKQVAIIVSVLNNIKISVSEAPVIVEILQALQKPIK